MSYGFNLSGVTLERFKKVIQEGYLIPSMRKLLEGIDQNFAAIESHGLTTVSELGQRIANQKKADDFSQQTGIDAAYMTALRRLVSSYKTKPRKLGEFPDIRKDQLLAMAEEGIKTSKALYEYLESEEDSMARERLGLSEAELLRVRALMEVTQLRYVSPLFATAMVMSGHDSISVVAGTDRERFLQALVKVNSEHSIYKGNIGDTDVQFLIDDARFFLEIQDRSQPRHTE